MSRKKRQKFFDPSRVMCHLMMPGRWNSSHCSISGVL